VIFDLRLSIGASVLVEANSMQELQLALQNERWIQDIDGRMINPMHIVTIKNWVSPLRRR